MFLVLKSQLINHNSPDIKSNEINPAENVVAANNHSKICDNQILRQTRKQCKLKQETDNNT